MLDNMGHLELREGHYGQARAYFIESLQLLRQVVNKTVVAECLTGMAGVAVRRSMWGRATRLIGATEALLRSIGLDRLDTLEQVEFEHTQKATQLQLDEATWQAAWEEGRAMSMDQAIE